MSDMFRGFYYYENLDKKSIKTKTLVNTGNASQERSTAKVET